ncbi:MAG: methyl-accepting chemotaxis protein, partial [Rhodospirillales bacterium]|nr:methyl-accepting chemotaxis protein [Rhodospirillales bacterium]
IGAQIAGIQAATQEAVAAIDSITKTISKINEVNSGVASAVEEQGAATQEIARNVEQAAAGTQEVSANIGGVSQAANETGTAAGQINQAAGELSQQSETLRVEVDKFLANVRSA